MIQQPSAPRNSRYKDARLKYIKIWDEQDAICHVTLRWYCVTETGKITGDLILPFPSGKGQENVRVKVGEN